jgi:hypothetical protein
VITVTVLNTVHHSPLLAVCAALTGAAAYLQAYVSPVPVLHLSCTMYSGVLPGGMAVILCAPCLGTVDGRQAGSGGGGRRRELGRGELIASEGLCDVDANNEQQLHHFHDYLLMCRGCCMEALRNKRTRSA